MTESGKVNYNSTNIDNEDQTNDLYSLLFNSGLEYLY